MSMDAGKIPPTYPFHIAKAYGVSAVEGVSGTGSLSLDAHVQGPIKQTDRLVYSGTGSLQNATINTPTLTKPLIVKTANLRFAQNSAVLENMQASLGSTTATGTATVRNFSAPQIQFALNADKLNITELQQITGGNAKRSSLDDNVRQRRVGYALRSEGRMSYVLHQLLTESAARHPDAIMIAPTDKTALIGPIQRAINAGIAVATVDTFITKPIAFTNVSY